MTRTTRALSCLLLSVSAVVVGCRPSGGGDGVPDAGGGVDVPVCDQACRDQARPDHCVSTQDYFAARAWPNVVQKCATCHVAGGAAGGTRYLLKPMDVPDALARNGTAFADAAKLEQDGQPLVLLKATLTVAHAGGQVVVPGSAEHAVLLEAIERARTPVTCPDEPEVDPEAYWNGVTLLDPRATLRRASFQVAGRLPTEAEIAAVNTGGLDALDAIIAAQVQTKGFHQHLRELFNDVFLTEAFSAENGDVALVSNGEVDDDVFPNAGNFQSAALYSNCTPGTEGCRRPTNQTLTYTGDALSREPLEFVIHAVKNDLPLTTIVTAKHRLVNAYSANVFGLGWDGHAPGTYDPEQFDPDDFRPARVPGINENLPDAAYEFSEYAGILTTPAWRRRSPNTCTNDNRKIARVTYKAFLDVDIMKNAARLDLSSIDLAAHPSRTNAQCTGCHAQIDPVAGAYMNWTPCHSAPGRYFPPSQRLNCGAEGWRTDAEMFPPGVGPGVENVLPRELWTHGLEKLGEHIAAQPGFSVAMARHLYTGLLGRPPLEPPPDPTAPGYLAADAAYEAQQAEFLRLVEVFRTGGQRVTPFVVALVKSRTFRAIGATTAGRAELLGLGGGTWLSPEVLDRKITSVFGAAWEELFQDAHGSRIDIPARGYGHLTRRDRERIFHGGIDSRVVTTRQRLPSGLASAVSDRMAYEMACLHVAREFAKPAAARLLLPRVDASLVPSGTPADVAQAPVVENLRYLLDRFWGLTANATSPEVLAAHALLVEAHAASVATGLNTLPKLCAGNFDPRSGLPDGRPSPTGPAVHVIRAWQALLVYLATDDRFLSE